MASQQTVLDGAVVAPPDSAKVASTQTQPGADGATTPAPDKDFKALYEAEVSEHAKTKHDRDSAMGRVKTNVPDQTFAELRAEIRRNAHETRALAIKLDPDLSAVERSAASTKLTQDQQEAQESARFTSHATRLANRLNTRLGKATFLQGNAELQRLLTGWNQSTSLDQVDDAYDALDDFIDTELDKYTRAEIKTANDKVEQERKRANRANGTLEVGAPTGTMPAGVTPATRDNIDGLYVAFDRAHPNDKNPYEDKYRTFISTGVL